mmetsp:Transcript_9264/g.24996  ORF Transcript_9264/g.24996 Transcript_9264/m.24996 type:complete len:224 (+) Transcript_9264:2077-2748(+)
MIQFFHSCRALISSSSRSSSSSSSLSSLSETPSSDPDSRNASSSYSATSSIMGACCCKNQALPVNLALSTFSSAVSRPAVSAKNCSLHAKKLSTVTSCPCFRNLRIRSSSSKRRCCSCSLGSFARTSAAAASFSPFTQSCTAVTRLNIIAIPAFSSTAEDTTCAHSATWAADRPRTEDTCTNGLASGYPVLWAKYSSMPNSKSLALGPALPPSSSRCGYTVMR